MSVTRRNRHNTARMSVVFFLRQLVVGNSSNPPTNKKRERCTVFCRGVQVFVKRPQETPEVLMGYKMPELYEYQVPVSSYSKKQQQILVQ